MLVDFGLLCGHMVGDYVVQNDWMAKNKVVFGDPEKDGKQYKEWVAKVTGSDWQYAGCGA